MLDWLRRLFAGGGQAQPAPGMITRTCKRCRKTFPLPEEVQHWPDYCQECRAKVRSTETVTRACRRCGKRFTFPASERQWPKDCPDCRAGRKG